MCESARPVTKTELCYTRALGHWMARKWNIAPARFDPATGRIAADPPPRTAAWFLTGFDDPHRVAITPHEEIA